jgi:hypothetical protein
VGAEPPRLARAHHHHVKGYVKEALIRGLAIILIPSIFYFWKTPRPSILNQGTRALTNRMICREKRKVDAVALCRALRTNGTTQGREHTQNIIVELLSYTQVKLI